MTNPHLEDLIQRLEGAEEGSRELDVRVAYAIDFQCQDVGTQLRQFVDMIGVEAFTERADRYQSIWSTALPAFSTSVDAALSLMPFPDQGFRLLQMQNGVCQAEVAADEEGDGYEMGDAETPALSICLAALKASAEGHVTLPIPID